MAGDWIKLELVTPDKPEVHRMAEILEMSAEQVLGGLCRVWIWADQQSVNGNALSVTENSIDRISRVAGLAGAMRNVGWIRGDDGALSLPNFDRHNGETAKKRALTNKRVATHRKRIRNADGVTKTLPEKRREDIKQDTPPPNGGSTVWDFGKSLLAEQGLSTKAAGALIGSWLREWDEPTVAEALRAAAGKADIKAYVAGVLKNSPRKSATASGEKRVPI